MGKKNKGGRPRKLQEPAARRKLLGLLRKGVSLAAASSLCGITEQTLRNKRREEPEFNRQVAEAEDYGRAQLEQRFFAGSQDDWKAAKAFLERKYFEDWAQRRPDSIEVRQLARQLPALVSIVLEFTASEKHDELRQRIDRWLENLLADDHNA